MPEPEMDRWTEWLLKRRYGPDRKAHEDGMRILRGVRDRVLKNAGLKEGSTLLDVGAGDGLIAFGALDRVGPDGTVIFSDISSDLLEICKRHAEEMGVSGRCRFINCPADDLNPIEDASVDAVTTRSVLIYVRDKRRAFNEFLRVLRPGGRVSLFEPINSFAAHDDPNVFSGINIEPIAEIAGKVRAVYEAIQGPDDPMLDFDERDLLRMVEEAGFREAHLEYEANLKPAPPQAWEPALDRSGNPLIPTLREAIAQVLTPEEAARFEEYVRPRFEAGGYMLRDAVAYLWAVKG